MKTRILISLILTSALLLSSCQSGQRFKGPSSEPCLWVFKTDSTNIGHIKGVIDKGKNLVTNYSVFLPEKLENSYYSLEESCKTESFYQRPQDTVVLKATSYEELLSYKITGENRTGSLEEAIKDPSPFDELYFCDFSLKKDLNKSIAKDRLESFCQKVI